MDRRRFQPSADVLDERVLLSIFSPPKASSSIPTATLSQKTIRIDHLAGYLATNEYGRVLPEGLVANLQADLIGVRGKLHDPSSAVLTAENLQLRATDTHASIHPEDVAGLRSNFNLVLTDAGASPQILTNFDRDIDQLVQLDSNGPTPAIIAANDYSLILQTALGVGRPILAPAVPSVAPADINGPKGSHITSVLQPHLVGAYSYNPGTVIHILDSSGNDLGSSALPSTGSYSVQFASPLSYGKHSVRVQAVDSNGDFSVISKPTVLTIRQAPARRHPATTTTTSTTTGSTPSGPLGFA